MFAYCVANVSNLVRARVAQKSRASEMRGRKRSYGVTIKGYLHAPIFFNETIFYQLLHFVLVIFNFYPRMVISSNDERFNTLGVRYYAYKCDNELSSVQLLFVATAGIVTDSIATPIIGNFYTVRFIYFEISLDTIARLNMLIEDFTFARSSSTKSN